MKQSPPHMWRTDTWNSHTKSMKWQLAAAFMRGRHLLRMSTPSPTPCSSGLEVKEHAPWRQIHKMQLTRTQRWTPTESGILRWQLIYGTAPLTDTASSRKRVEAVCYGTPRGSKSGDLLGERDSNATPVITHHLPTNCIKKWNLHQEVQTQLRWMLKARSEWLTPQ